MGVIQKQSVKGTIYVYIGVVLGFITSGILLPRLYSTEQIGLLKNLVAYSALFAQFGTLGINGAIIILFPYFRDKEKKHNGFLILILFVGLVGFILTSALQIIFRPILIDINIEKAAMFIEYLNYLVILVFFQIFFSILDIYYSALFNSAYGIFLREILQRLSILLLIGVFFFDLITFHQFVLFYILAISFPTFFLVLRLIRIKQFSLHCNFKFLNKTIIHSIVSISAFSILNNFSMVFIQNIDIIMVTSMQGIAEAGIYTTCFFFGVVVSLPSRPINRIANIVSAEAWKINDLKTIRDVYNKSCLTLFIFGMFLFLGLWVNIDNVFSILGKSFEPGKWVIFFIGLSSLIDLTTGANNSILGTSRYYRVSTIFLLILLILVVLMNLLLIPKFGITGASIGSAVSLTVLNLLRFLFLYFKFKLQPFDIRFLWVLILGLAAYIIANFISPLPNFVIDIFIRSSIFTILFCVPVYLLRISPEINDKADVILKSLNLKK